MERIWLKQYPAGVPADIDVNQYSSLVELLEESFKKFADRKAFICMDKSISYRDLDEMSAALGAYLQSKGLQKGARVALMMPNVLQYPVATSAVLAATSSRRAKSDALAELLRALDPDEIVVAAYNAKMTGAA